MKRITIALALIGVALLVGHSSALALGPIAFKDGVIRLKDGATVEGPRSLVMRGTSLIMVLPEDEFDNQIVKINDPLVKDARLVARNNRSELELRLNEAAERVLSRFKIRTAGDDLLISILPALNENKERQEAKNNTQALKAAAENMGIAEEENAKPAIPEVKAEPKGNKKEKGEELFGRKDKEPSNLSMWGLVLVAAAGAFAAWYIQNKKRRSKVPFDAHIDVISSRPLAAKQRLVLVEVGGEMMLLGCTEKEINLLRTVDTKQFEQKTENNFFAEGMRMDADNSGGGALEAQPPREMPSNPVRAHTASGAAANFIDRLGKQLKQRQMTKVVKAQEEAKTKEPEPLDEQWAAGLVRMRRARGGQGQAQPQPQPQNNDQIWQ